MEDEAARGIIAWAGMYCTCTTSYILQYREGMPEFFGIALGIITYYMIPFPNSFSDDFVA